MAVYLLREVGRTPTAAQADRTAPDPTPAAPPPSTPVAIKEPPTRATIPKTQVQITPSTPSSSDAPARPAEEVQPPETARIMPTGPNPKLDAIMGEANRAYDSGDFDEAKQIAQKVLQRSPGNVRMLRIVVSSECIAGDSAEAQKYFAQLPVEDRAQMRTRCDRYGVTLKDP
jgi:predicted Zn-dependent protease